MKSRSLAMAVTLAMLALAGGVALSPVLAAPATRYVNPVGFDIKIIGGTPIPNLSCTKSYPCKTIKWAVQTVAKAGDTVSVAAGTYHERVTITKSMTVVGAGTRKTIVDGDAAGTVFRVQNSASAQIKQMRIRDGKAALGGGISVAGGSALSMTNVTVIGNTAGSGGGIYSYGTLKLTRVVIYGNHGTSNSGGGLTNGGTATLDRTDIQQNDAVNGAAIYNIATLTMTNSAIRGNSTPNGYPGIYNQGGSVTLTNVTLSNNTTGLSLNQGGAIFQSGLGADTTLNYVTISGNSQGQYGAIYRQVGTVSISNSIIYGNGASPQCGSASATGYTDGGYNVTADQSCGFVLGSGSILGNPGLKPLDYYGGFTPTRALKSTSVAIDLVPKTRCVAQDQRGVARPKDGDGNGTFRCDAGAYEYP